MVFLLSGCGPVAVVDLVKRQFDSSSRDPILPEVSIESSPAAFSSDTTVTFVFRANKENVAYSVDLDGDGFFRTPGDTFTASGLADGTHSLQVRGTDPQGRVAELPEAFEWVVDTQAPSPPHILDVISLDPRTFTVTWIATADVGSGVDRFRILYSTGSGPPAALTVDGAVRVATVDNLAPCNEYDVSMVSIDRAGNVSAPRNSPPHRVRCGGDGTFSAVQSYPAGTRPTCLRTADFDDDGTLDLVMVDFATNDVAVLPGLGDGTFGEALKSAAVWRIGSLAVGDFDSDSRPDLVVTDLTTIDAFPYGGQLKVLRGLGDGTFDNSPPRFDPDFTGRDLIGPPFPIIYGDLHGPILVETADLNADGYVDVVAAISPENSFSQADVLSLLTDGFNGMGSTELGGRSDLGDLQPSHVGKHERRAGGSFSAMTLGYFNDDVYLDVALCDLTTVRVLLGTGFAPSDPLMPNLPDGAFGVSQALISGGDPRSITSGDFNGDQRADLAVSNDEGTVSVLLGSGDGSGTFEPARTFFLGDRAGVIGHGDFNGDSITDLVVAGSRDEHLSLLLGNGADGRGDGTFREPEDFPCGPAPSSIAVADFNGDLIEDVAVTNMEAGTVTVLLTGANQPRSGRAFERGEFIPIVATDTAAAPWIATADVNNDGALDLIAAPGDGRHVGNFVDVILAETVNGQGTGVFKRPLPLFVDKEDIQRIVAEDLDHDGIVDLAVSFRPGVTASSYDAAIALLRGQGSAGRGSGTFAEYQSFRWDQQLPFTGTESIGEIVPGDFNYDGIRDLVVVTAADDSDRPGVINVLFGSNEGGRGDGTLVHSFKSLDDLYAEAGLASPDSLGCSTPDIGPILANQGSGLRFPTERRIGTEAETTLVATGDLDGDGGSDLVAVDNLERVEWRVIALRNFGRACAHGDQPDRPGLGVFEDPVVLFELDGDFTFRPFALMVEDFNSDGVPDIAVAATSGDGDSATPELRVRLGARANATAPGLDRYTLGPERTFRIPINSWRGYDNVRNSAIVHDLDHDGALDVVLGLSRLGSVAVLWGNKADGRADGTFADAQLVGTLPVSHYEVSAEGNLVVGDFNGDGIADLAVCGGFDPDPDGTTTDQGIQIMFGKRK